MANLDGSMRGWGFRPLFGVSMLALWLPACGGGVDASAAAVGKVGRTLSGHAQAVPQGAETCAVEKALSKAPDAKTPESTACADALKSDQLWRGSMKVLAAYGQSMESLASGADAESTGAVEAALTGIDGPGWIDVEDAEEKAAADAAASLVDQMQKRTGDDDLESTVKAAAPHVKTICDGLGVYLDKHAEGLANLQKDLDEKRKTPLARRCAMMNGAPLCVSDSLVDRLVYAGAFGRLATLEENHQDAGAAVAGFCAAHEKLNDAAEAGTLSDDETYAAIVDAVKSGRSSRASSSSDSDAEETPEPSK